MNRYNQNEYQIKKEAQLLVDSVVSLSDNLPNSEIYQIKSRLKNCVSLVPESLERGFKTERKIDKIKCMIRANGALTECKDYLSLVGRLQYSNTDELINQVDKISLMIDTENLFSSKH